jgi:predicted HAD superfamily Cof-like phosphohydrolase
MREAQLMVQDFHEKYGQHVSKTIKTPPKEVLILRRALIAEESKETIEAIDFLLSLDPDLERRTPEWYQAMALVADGLADTIYVILGTAVACGIDLDKVFCEIHRSNMTKTPAKAAPGQKYAPGGGKGPNFSPARVREVLFGAVRRKDAL